MPTKRSSSRWISALVALTSLALGGCGSVVNGQSMVATRPDLVSVTVTNTLTAPVCRLWMTPIDSEEWGLDWIAGQDSLAVGAQRELRVPRGHWDLRVSNCEGAPLAELESLLIDEANNALSLGAPPPPARRPYVYNPAAGAPGGEAPAPPGPIPEGGSMPESGPAPQD